MNLTDQVTDLEISQKLKMLGAPQKSLFYHHPAFGVPVFGETVYDGKQICNLKDKAVSAFTVSELIELIEISRQKLQIAVGLKLSVIENMANPLGEQLCELLLDLFNKLATNYSENKK